jgi:hypothetical protein
LIHDKIGRGMARCRGSESQSLFRVPMTPTSLDLRGGTQPEIFKATVDAMVLELLADPARFWQQALAQDGPIEIWEISGERWLYNGNHRYQAAVLANVEIPDSQIIIVDQTGSSIPTWRFDQMIWLAGVK